MKTIYNIIGYKKEKDELIPIPTGWRTNSLSKAILITKICKASRNLLFYEVIADENGLPDDSICYYSTNNEKDYPNINCLEFLSKFEVSFIFDNCVKLLNNDFALYVYCYYENNNFIKPKAGAVVYEEFEDEEIYLNLDEKELDVLQNILDKYNFKENQFGHDSISNKNNETIKALEECIELIKECDDCFCSEDDIVYIDQHSILEILRNKIKELNN